MRSFGPLSFALSLHVVTRTSEFTTRTIFLTSFFWCDAAASIIEKRHISEQFTPLSIVSKARARGSKPPPSLRGSVLQLRRSYSTTDPCAQCSLPSGYGGCMTTTQRFCGCFSPFLRVASTPAMTKRASLSSIGLRMRSCSTTMENVVPLVRAACTASFRRAAICVLSRLTPLGLTPSGLPATETTHAPTLQPFSKAWPSGVSSLTTYSRVSDVSTTSPSGAEGSNVSVICCSFGSAALAFESAT